MTGNDAFVDRLVVGVTYETDTGSIDTVMGQFRGAFDALTGFAGALVAAAAAGGVFALAQASSMDETAKLAREIRTTTEDLTAMQFAAARSGVGAGHLERGLQRLTLSLGELSAGAGPGGEALASLGLGLEDADGNARDAVGSLGDIAEALSGITDEARQADIASDIFGRTVGTRMLLMLRDGRAGIEEITDEAHRLGLVLSTESAEAAEDLMDAMEGLRGVVRGLGWQIADVLIPPMTRAVEGLTDWLTAADGIVRTGLDRSMVGLSWALERLETPLGKVTAGVVGLAGAIGLARGAASLGGGAVGRFAAPLALLGGKAAIAAGAVALVAAAVDDVVTFMGGGDSVIGRFFDHFGEGQQSLLDDTEGLLSEMSRTASGLAGIFGDVRNSGVDLFNESMPEWVPELRSLSGTFASMLAFKIEEQVAAWAWAFRQLGDAIAWVAENFDAEMFVGFSAMTATGGLLGRGMVDRATSRALGADMGPLGSSPASDSRAAGNLSLDTTVNISGGMSLRDMAEAAAEAVRRQILREADAMAGL